MSAILLKKVAVDYKFAKYISFEMIDVAATLLDGVA